jgi:hypothetical protein
LIIPFIDNMLQIQYDGNPSQVQIKKWVLLMKSIFH